MMLSTAGCFLDKHENRALLDSGSSPG